MFTVKFVWTKDQEYGEYGWIPKDHPEFNMVSGFGLAHDVLEHFKGDTSDLNGEMRAFGAMLLIRAEGDWQPYRGYRNRPMSEDISSDLARFIREQKWSDDRLSRPPRTYKLNEYVEQVIADAFAETYRIVKAENEYEHDENDKITHHEAQVFLEKALGWMRIGYRKAARRYHNAPPHYLASLFNDIECQTYKVTGDFGDELVVSVSPKRLISNVRVISPQYYD